MYAVERENEPDVFNDDIRIHDTTLRDVVLHLEGVNLTATDLDTKGVAFEQFMDGFFKGDFGQYFTPRNIADKMTRGGALEADIGFNLKSWQQLRFESTRQLEEALTESVEIYYQLRSTPE